mgnify:CR=1 FL=1
MIKKVQKICCIGAGYVGGPTMAVIAERCPHIQIEVVDINIDRINAWNSENLSELPIYEPGLAEIISKCRNKNLHFSNKLQEKIKEADMIFISVNTPTKLTGVGAGKASDLKWVEASARQVASYSKGHTIVVEKSTLPVRTAEVIKSILKSVSELTPEEESNKTFDVLSNPEFLAEGSAVNDLLYPDRVLIGGESKSAISQLSQIYENWVPREKILETNIWSSELAKLTANAFLAQRISSINSIGAICEATGADVREVARAIGTDSRIGSKFLNSGPGFGGSCFKKDILNLVYLSEHFGLPEVANFWEEVVKLNDWHQRRIPRLIAKKLFGTLSGKKIGILGFAFKANTNDTRESAAIQICKDLIEEGANLLIHDPKVSTIQICKDLKCDPLNIEKEKLNSNEFVHGSWKPVNNKYDVFNNSDAVLLLTEWEEYKKIKWDLAFQKLRKPAWVFDSRSILDSEEVNKAGINFWRFGNGLN